MKFLILTAFLYFGFLFYQNSLMTPIEGDRLELTSVKESNKIDYSIYYRQSDDIFSVQSIDDSFKGPLYQLVLYSILDSLHFLPFVRNFLQKTYTMSDWLKLSQAFYFSFFKDKNGLQFLWVTPTSDKILSKLSVGQRDNLNFGGIAQIKWSVYDILFIKLSQDKSQILLSSAENGAKRLPAKANHNQVMSMTKGFLPNLKHVLKGDSLSWLVNHVDAILIDHKDKSFDLKLALSQNTKFYASFLKMSSYEQNIKYTNEDLSFQVNLAQFLEMIDPKKVQTAKIKGAQFFLKNKDLFDGNFFLRAKVFETSPKVQLQSSFKNPGSSARFISELERYVAQKSLDLSKMDKNSYSLTIPFSPIQFFLRRQKKDIFLSNSEPFSEAVVETNKKALFHFSMFNIAKKELFVPHIERLLRSYHKKRLLACFENLSKKDALFKYCPMGGNYSVEGESVKCEIHGYEQSSNFLSLVKNDSRRQSAFALLDTLEKLQLSFATYGEGLTLRLSL